MCMRCLCLTLTGWRLLLVRAGGCWRGMVTRGLTGISGLRFRFLRWAADAGGVYSVVHRVGCERGIEPGAWLESAVDGRAVLDADRAAGVLPVGAVRWRAGGSGLWEGRVCSGRSGRRVFLMTSAVLVDVLRLVEAVCRGWLPECSCSEGGSVDEC